MKKVTPFDKAKRMAEFKEYQKTQKAQIKKARKLKPEFDELPFADKIKFMDDNFGGISGIGDEKGVIISVYPDNTPEQIRLFNEWLIKKWEGFEGDLFDDYLFKRLKGRFENSIEQIRKINDFPDDLIRDFVARELDTYSERIKDPIFQKEMNFYKGNWDLSRKVIDTTFLMARAFSNYISFLKKQIDKGITQDKPEKTFPEFLHITPDDKKEWFADQLKKEFNTGKGKKIAYMIEALKNMNILLLGERQGQEIYNAISNYFQRDIGAKWWVTGKNTLNLTFAPGRQSDIPGINNAEERIKLIINQINKG